MKISEFLRFSAVLAFASCTSNHEPDPTPAFNYDQASANIITATAPQVTGSWLMRKVYVTHQPYNPGQRELKIRQDTVYQNLATLTVRPVNRSQSVPQDARYAKFEGEITYRTKTYPIQFTLSAAPNRVVNQEGPQAIFLLEYNFPPGSHYTEPEEKFLWYQLSLIGENFSLEIASSQLNSMTWRGANRGINQIDLVKQ